MVCRRLDVGAGSRNAQLERALAHRGGIVQWGWRDVVFRFGSAFRWSGILLAVAYAVVFWAARQVSVDQWVLSAGIRVGALLLLPPRCWIYLIAGEYAAFAYARYPLIDRFGLTWALVSSAVLMPAVACIVHWHKRLTASANDYWVISVAALSAICVTALNLGSAYLFMPFLHEAVSWNGAFKYVLGDYLGILTVAPLVVMWKRPRHSGRLFGSRWIDIVASLAIVALLTGYVMLPRHLDMGEMSSSHVLLPAIALLCLAGWRVMAVGVAGASLAIGLTMHSTGLPGSHDQDAYISQQLLLVSGTTLLLVSAIISFYRQQLRQRDRVGKQAIGATRTYLLAGEQGVRQSVGQMKVAGDRLDDSFRNAVQWLYKNGFNTVATDVLVDVVTQTHRFREQLNRLYPSDIEQYGLYLVLQTGVIADDWRMTYRLAKPHLAGNPCQLSLDLQLAAYRSICEAVALLLEQEPGTIKLSARCGNRRGYRGIIINVALIDASHVLSTATKARASEMLMAPALAFSGAVRCDRNRIRMLLGELAVSP
ncbi:MASE1 domain-containing protein [[Pseudomonas] boreopolis]|uniref:MASE1 domain-containing protein n=1 Tax=Xanthomonas boreopolis TaxID=86183 RepID=UPI003D9BB400